MAYRHQQTLDSITTALAGIPPELPVYVEGPDGDAENIDDVSSWRGDYSQLQIERGGDRTRTVRWLLRRLQEADGKAFEGYKGGSFVMHGYTPVWIERYGESSCVAAAEVEEYEKRVLIRGFQVVIA